MSRRHKSIVICLDDQRVFDINSRTSAVLRFYSYLSTGEPLQKILLTNFEGGTTSRNTMVDALRKISRSNSRSMEKDKIFQVYLFIANHYEKGDRISIFTSGQGAQIACAVVGMIHQVGILVGSAKNNALYDSVYDAFIEATFSNTKSESGEGTNLNQEYKSKAQNIKENYSISAKVEFLGLWNAEGTELYDILSPSPSSPLSKLRYARSLRSSSPGLLIPTPNDEVSSDSGGVDLLDVWFEGNGDEDGGLSNISVRWMINQCKASNADALFDPNKVPPPPEETEDSSTFSNQNIPEDKLLPTVIKCIKNLIDSPKPSAPEPMRRARSIGLNRTPRKPAANAVDLTALFKPFLLSVGLEKAVDNRTEGERGARNADSNMGGSQGSQTVEKVVKGKEAGGGAEGSQWDRNVDLQDVLSSRVTGDSQLPKEGRLNIHWTVKKRLEVIQTLGESNFKERKWSAECTQQWLGDGDLSLLDRKDVNWKI